MTEPKRWSDPKSDVDPVLRSVVRYAQELEPSPAELQRLLRATAARSAPTRDRRIFRRFAAGVGLGLAAAFGGVAWASHGGGWFGATAPAASALPAARPQVARVLRSAPLAAASAAVAEAPSARSAPPRASGAPALSAASPSPSASVAPALSDTELLQQARASVGSNPGRALTLTRDHEVRFPSSALTEERQALRIEALSRLGRQSEAARELDVFEARYPRSPYRRRLRSLVTP